MQIFELLIIHPINQLRLVVQVFVILARASFGGFESVNLTHNLFFFFNLTLLFIFLNYYVTAFKIV